MRSAGGSGTQRLYGFRDILVLRVVKRLLDSGVSLQQIRSAVSHLRERGVEDLSRITLMSDGASVYECTSDDEVIDLVQGGQGVFGIALGKVWRGSRARSRHCPPTAARRSPSSTAPTNSPSVAPSARKPPDPFLTLNRSRCDTPSLRCAPASETGCRGRIRFKLSE
ncbi:hypothetical protein GCM10025876_38080 [Demequina litorisediminis]|uniref:HTH merR-type domain-containing protein n=1 Tax=Demequina litorisediminis TaxID=1849022 RepID=A0ABQ6ILP3_9MICO|nr:hypothetical protein GCM10025876_38080 [Demequina litorisediminis]